MIDLHDSNKSSSTGQWSCSFIPLFLWFEVMIDSSNNLRKECICICMSKSFTRFENKTIERREMTCLFWNICESKITTTSVRNVVHSDVDIVSVGWPRQNLCRWTAKVAFIDPRFQYLAPQSIIMTRLKNPQELNHDRRRQDVLVCHFAFLKCLLIRVP